MEEMKTGWVNSTSDTHVYCLNNYFLVEDVCIDGKGHCIRWIPSQTSAGRPGDMDEVCVKCGRTLRTEV